jgi:hypothetical protein
MSRDFPGAYLIKVTGYSKLGRFEQALASLKEATVKGPRDRNGLYSAELFARMGRGSEARAILEAFHPAPNERQVPGMVISALAELGDLDAAFAKLNIAVDDHIPGLIWVKSEPGFAPLRSDPRFQLVLARMGNP